MKPVASDLAISRAPPPPRRLHVSHHSRHRARQLSRRWDLICLDKCLRLDHFTPRLCYDLISPRLRGNPPLLPRECFPHLLAGAAVKREPLGVPF